MHFFIYLLMGCLPTFNADTVTTSTVPRQLFTAMRVNDSQVEVQEISLFSRLGHKETGYGKSAFSFWHGLRSDNEQWFSVTHNYADLLYGSLSTNDDSDRFCVSGR